MTPTGLEHAPFYAAAIIAAGGGRRPAGVVAATPHDGVDPQPLPRRGARDRRRRRSRCTQRAGFALAVLAPLTSLLLAASATGRRWRLSDLGAGEELRAHEQARRWLWQPAAARAAGERVHIVTQGQIVRERPWPADRDVRPADRRRGRAAGAAPLGPPRLHASARPAAARPPSALRAAAGRAAEGPLGAVLRRPEGRPAGARVPARPRRPRLGVPFIVFDPRDPDSQITGSRCGATGPPRSSPASSPASRPASRTTPTRCACTSGSSPASCTSPATGRPRCRCSSRPRRSRAV